MDLSTPCLRVTVTACILEASRVRIGVCIDEFIRIEILGGYVGLESR